MAIKQIGVSTGNNVRRYSGLTSDPKPKTDRAGICLGDGSSYKELDDLTKEVKAYYTFHDGEWYKL
jgi:hypothetical protein